MLILGIFQRICRTSRPINIADGNTGPIDHQFVSLGDRFFIEKVCILLLLKRIDHFIKQLTIRAEKATIRNHKDASDGRVLLFQPVQYPRADKIKVSHASVEEYPDTHVNRLDDCLLDIFFFYEKAVSVADEQRRNLFSFHTVRK